jgi:hypothetical protein
MLIATAVQMKWRIMQLDVKTTFFVWDPAVTHVSAKRICASGKWIQGIYVSYAKPFAAEIQGALDHLEWKPSMRFSEVRGFQEVESNWIVTLILYVDLEHNSLVEGAKDLIWLRTHPVETTSSTTEHHNTRCMKVNCDNISTMN